MRERAPQPTPPGACSSATNCLTHAADPDGTVWLSSTRRPDVRLRVDPDEWPSRPATLGGPGELADARHELDVLKALADAATAGPWYRAKNHSRASVAAPDNAIGAFNGPGMTRYIAVVGDGGCHGDTDEQSNADAEFIAAAREAVPTLIAALERERTEHAQWAFDAGHATGEYLRQVKERHSADLAAARAERDRAVAHDRQPYPTADAYEAACAALEKHRERAERAEAERDQLRYERRLLGFARHVLDRAAEFHNLRPVDREHVEREAADVAQRIVDEIGHPVTDEPALGPTYREQIAALTAERDRRGDELRRAHG